MNEERLIHKFKMRSYNDVSSYNEKIVKCRLARGEITREPKAACKKHTITTCCWLYCLGFSMEKLFIKFKCRMRLSYQTNARYMVCIHGVTECIFNIFSCIRPLPAGTWCNTLLIQMQA